MLGGVAPAGDVLAEVRVPDVGLVAALDRYAGRVEVGDVAVVDVGPEGVDNLDASAAEIGVEQEVPERDELVVVRRCVGGER